QDQGHDGCGGHRRSRGFRSARARRAIVRDEVKKDLRAYADTDAAETPEEEIDRREIANSEAHCQSRENADAEKEIGAESLSRIFSDCVTEKEKEIQELADAECIADGIAVAFSHSNRHA